MFARLYIVFIYLSERRLYYIQQSTGGLLAIIDIIWSAIKNIITAPREDPL